MWKMYKKFMFRVFQANGIVLLPNIRILIRLLETFKYNLGRGLESMQF